MLNKDDFIDFILNGPEQAAVAADAGESALPEGLEGFGFDTEDAPPAAEVAGSSFAKRLLEASGFGLAKQFQRDSVIRSSDAVARHLPSRVSFWDKTPTRPYRTLLFEADIDHAQLLKIPAFRNRQMAHLDIVEDALSRFVEEALKGFQQGGQDVTADVVKGRKEETLCVISIFDKREWKETDGTVPPRLVCFGTYNANKDGGLETFRITEQTRSWEPHLAREHLGLLYKRQFKKLSGHHWQEAFTTTDERKQAKKLLEVCCHNPTEETIQESVLGLLDTIAKGFGLSKKSATDKLRLRADQLPPDHDIGMEPETRANEEGGKNPFRGVMLRDEEDRLLGYIIYPLKDTTDADRLRTYLKEHNRFHNVLVVYPDHEETRIELWQGTDQLQGKLRRGQGYKDAAEVVNLLSRFFVVSKAKVNNPPELAKELAYRARYLRSIALEQLEQEPDSGELRALHAAFKEALVHDQTEEEFADAFAQTLTYSLLTARWVLSAQGGKSGDRFTRKAAMKKLAIGSRFLSEMFTAVLSMQLESQNRLHWLIDDLTGLLDRVDVVAVFQDDGSDLTADPIIHFYEPFLKEYDAKIRMQRGVFYTPRPVVSYIVRSVDELLRTEFGLEDGLADTATWDDMVKRMAGLEIPEGATPEQGFVQILDPATGTGTFLVEVIDVIHATMVTKWTEQGHDEARALALWNKYVPEQLLPRLYGYELMMAPYAIAHLKIGLKLHETGYKFGGEGRTQVYLTNALEPAQDFSGTLAFAVPALAHEAEEVNAVKRDQRFTVVVGNPPYAGHSSNQSAWMDELMEAYKTTVREQERQIQRLSNDYVKFFRLAQLMLETSQLGVFGFISDAGYLKNVLFRDMRSALLTSYGNLWLHDLHGVQMRGPTHTGQVDENVFDITQPVAISLFSTGTSSSPRRGALYSELVGPRQEKYEALLHTTYSVVDTVPIDPVAPMYRFIPYDSDSTYDGWPTFIELIGTGNQKNDRDKHYGTGIKTRHDQFAIGWDAEDAIRRIRQLAGRSENDANLIKELKLCTTAHFSIVTARSRAAADDLADKVRRIAYRPFDSRSMVYLREFICEPKFKTMGHMCHASNVAMGVLRRNRRENGAGFFVARGLMAKDLVSNLDDALIWPLYVYPAPDDQQSFGVSSKYPMANIPRKVSAGWSEHFGLEWQDFGKGDLVVTLGPEDIFNYIYAIVNSPGYRETYSKQVNGDYPRVPFLLANQLFRRLAKLGGELVKLHLMESLDLGNRVTMAIGLESNSRVEKVSYSSKTVWIDSAENRGFRGVADDVWNFYIGGYQVCKKWLTDRQAKGGKSPRAGRVLTDEDIAHYQKIIVAISETIRIMGEIDEVIGAHGGWPGAFVTESEDDA